MRAGGGIAQGVKAGVVRCRQQGAWFCEAILRPSNKLSNLNYFSPTVTPVKELIQFTWEILVGL